MLLEGKVASMTGSSRGIGAATAKLLAANGAKVTVNYTRDRDHGEEVVAEITKAGGRAILVQADVTVVEQVTAMVTKTETDLGPVNILVNNASIRFPVMPFVDYQWEEFERKLVNEMKASFFCCQAVAKSMIERHTGCIVNVSSGLFTGRLSYNNAPDF